MQKPNGMAYEVPLVAVRYARHLMAFLETRGIGRQVLLNDSDIDEALLDNPDAFLSMKQVVQLVRHARRLLPDERAPFQFGQQLDLQRHGLLGFALLKQRDQQELIGLIIQHLRVCLPILDMEYQHSGEALSIRLRDIWDLGSLRPFFIKIYMGSIHSLMSLVCTDFHFSFDFPSRQADTDWRGLVDGATLDFGCECNKVSMLLSGRPARDDDVDLSYYLVGAQSRERVELNNVMEVVMRVRRQILENPGREATLERVAQQLGMSPRSVRRHLHLVGSSFNDIRNEIRQDFATRYLTDTRISLEQIARRLGYSDQASFTRAYRSWTGKTPGSVRRASLLRP